MEKNEKVNAEEIEQTDLVSAKVCFPKVLFSSEKDCLSPVRVSADGVNVIRSLSFQLTINWILLGVRSDKKGIVIGCNFAMNGDPLKIDLVIQVKMEFKKPAPEQQIFHSTFFQVLAAKIFFPYLVELIASNTHKMEFGTSPLVLDDKLLNVILENTLKQGAFEKKPENRSNPTLS